MEKNFGLGKLLEHEVKLLETAMPELKANIQKGEEFVHKNWACAWLNYTPRGGEGRGPLWVH